METDDLWTLAESKAKRSEVIEHAQTSGPRTITCNGRYAVVVDAVDE